MRLACRDARHEGMSHRLDGGPPRCELPIAELPLLVVAPAGHPSSDEHRARVMPPERDVLRGGRQIHDLDRHDARTCRVAVAERPVRVVAPAPDETSGGDRAARFAADGDLGDVPPGHVAAAALRAAPLVAERALELADAIETTGLAVGGGGLRARRAAGAAGADALVLANAAAHHVRAGARCGLGAFPVPAS